MKFNLTMPGYLNSNPEFDHLVVNFWGRGGNLFLADFFFYNFKFCSFKLGGLQYVFLFRFQETEKVF